MSVKENTDENKVIVSSTGKGIGQTFITKIKNNKKILLILGVILVIIAIVFLSLLLIGKPNNTKKANPTIVKNSKVCTTKQNFPILMQAAGYIYQGNYQKLSQSITAIEKLKNYQYDPNCLYAVLTYNIYTGNIKDATNYLNDLKRVYPRQGFSKVYVDPSNLATLSIDVNSMQARANYQKQDVSGMKPPK
jgi:hypothetical protein